MITIDESLNSAVTADALTEEQMHYLQRVVFGHLLDGMIEASTGSAEIELFSGQNRVTMEVAVVHVDLPE